MKKIILIFLIPLFLFSCQKDDVEVVGCTDDNSLNYDYTATKDDGSCEYSTATFYASYGYYNGVQINSIDVTIDGENIGTINSVYPNGVGNCSAPGTVLYQFYDGYQVDWNTVVHLYNGGVVYSSGVLEPRSTECIKVNVTK